MVNARCPAHNDSIARFGGLLLCVDFCMLLCKGSTVYAWIWVKDVFGGIWTKLAGSGFIHVERVPKDARVSRGMEKVS